MTTPETKIIASASTTVDASNTAIAAQSGSLCVFGTPFMIALMEKATCNAVEPLLEAGETTVGTGISVTHDKASGIGTNIVATAELLSVDGRRLTFSVVARDDDDSVIGKGTIERFVVNADKFMARIDEK